MCIYGPTLRRSCFSRRTQFKSVLAHGLRLTGARPWHAPKMSWSGVRWRGTCSPSPSRPVLGSPSIWTTIVVRGSPSLWTAIVVPAKSFDHHAVPASMLFLRMLHHFSEPPSFPTFFLLFLVSTAAWTCVALA